MAHNCGALAHRFVIEGVTTQFRRYRFGAFIRVFDVAAQRDQGDDILGAVPIGTTPERFAKTDGKRSTRTPRSAGQPRNDQIHAQSDQHAQCDDEQPDSREYQHKTFPSVLNTSNNR